MLAKFDDMLKQLVAEPSISSTTADIDRSNLRVIEHLANWLEDLGFATEVMVLPNRPDKANLIATLGANGKPHPGGLVLAGHTDTVPVDPSLWQSDPFQLRDSDQRFYGLGSCDMKGFFPVALHAAAAFVERDLAAPLTIVATSDEESSMAGSRYLLESGKPKADYAIIGEPTAMQPIYAHKGVSMISVQIQGAAGHSSDPSLGHNALETMHPVMGALMQFRDELAQQHQHPSFAVNVPTLNLGCLRAGDNPNRICGHAELQIDLRLLPGMDSDAIHKQLEQRCHDAVAGSHTQLTVSTVYPPIPPFESAADGELTTTLAALSGKAPGTVAFGTEAHFLQTLGMQTVVWGPGSIDQAHQPNEYLEQSHIRPAIETLQQVIGRYCLA
ncbi:MAG: acetylornithine deacetylase [Pseudomonadota bacterium]|nr:acetylornithine deacetylase [Pseudomonadota bacterium]MEC8047918.1 acetylornithine deacetylase [Pseudomonadota bacterium]